VAELASISRYVNLPRSGSVQTVVGHEKEEMNGDLESSGISANSTSAPGRARIGLGVTAAVVLPLLYLPYEWLLVIDYPWGSYRWHWIVSWPGLPLRLMLHPLINRWSATVECIVATIATVPLVCVLVYLGSRGRKALASVSLVVLLLSLVNSWIAYKAFLW
jgi:hypothetical protein